MTNYSSISAIVLDLIMPKMNGFEFLEVLKNDQRFNSIPVFVTTEANNSDYEDKALSLGAIDFIHKPYQPLIIYKKINNTLELLKMRERINILEKDSLTSLYNLEAFNYYGQKLIINNEYLLYVLNINNFKFINRNFGYKFGDKLLLTIANIFKMVISIDDIVCRVYADEFAILASNNFDIQTVINSLNNSQIINNYNIGIRIGCVRVNEENISIKDYFDLAKIASNQLFRNSKEIKISYYDSSLLDQMMYSNLLINDFDFGIKNKEFVVHFQPKHALNTNKVVGAEALVRWNHPILGYIKPDDFISLYEKNDLITTLDFYVWNKTCEFLANKLIPNNIIIPISINVSRVDLFVEDLCEQLALLIKQYKIPINLIHIEITESYASINKDQFIDAVNKLKKQGFIIELDDFGTGYSSLNILEDLPIDILKLDLRFIKNIKKGNHLLEYIIILAKYLNLQVIAEGIETKEELQLLNNLGCQLGQGYYYSRPLDEENFLNYLANNK